MDWEVAGSSTDTQRIQPKPTTPIIKNGETRGWIRIHPGDRERYLVSSCPHQALNKNGETRGWIKIFRKLRVDAYKKLKTEIKQERWDPWVDKSPPRWRNSTLTSEYQDCHMQLWKKQKFSEFKSSSKRSKVILIEKHFKPTCSRITSTTHFSNNSKAMIRELGNVKLFELCETAPKVQCSHCLLHWNQRIVFWICGQFLVESESRRKFHKLGLDALSIPHYVIKKGRCHGARHGKTEKRKGYQKAWNAWKRCSMWTFQRYSRSISQRSSLSWITTRKRMDWTKVQRDGRTCDRKSHVPSLYRGF